MKLTKREKLVAVIVGILILLVFTIPPELIKDEHETAYLLLIVLPIGALIATDPERKR